MAKFQARLFDELTPLYPDTDPSTGVDRYEIAGANGAYVGVHICVDGLTPGYPVNLKVEGPHRAYKLFSLLPVPVEVNTGADQRSEYLKDDHNENVIRRAPFFVYEIMEPIYNTVMPSMTTAAFAFRTPVEYCREKETKHWTITVSHRDEEHVLHVDVVQYPAVIPKADRTTHQYINWFSMETIARAHHMEKWTPAFLEMLERYLRLAVYSRQNMLNISMGDIFDLDAAGNPMLNEARLTALVETAHKAGMALFQGGAFCHRAENLADDDAFYASLDHEHFTTPEQIGAAFKKMAFYHFDYGKDAVFGLTGESMSAQKGQDQLRSALVQLNGYLNAHGLRDSWTQCCLDEPNDALENVYHVISRITREALPGVPILEPVLPTEAVIGDLDIWCPTVETYEKNRDFFEQRVAAGDRLFVYTCLTPGGNYCNRLLDMERLRMVWLGWAPALYPSVEGFLHWGANHSLGHDPQKRQAAMFSEQVMEYHPKYANFLPAGDPAIFYPGYETPLASVRSEAHRIGYEDLYLLKAMAQKDPDRVEKLVRQVFRGYADYEKSVEVYRQVRQALLEMALELL